MPGNNTTKSAKALKKAAQKSKDLKKTTESFLTVTKGSKLKKTGNQRVNQRLSKLHEARTSLEKAKQALADSEKGLKDANDRLTKILKHKKGGWKQPEKNTQKEILKFKHIIQYKQQELSEKEKKFSKEIEKMIEARKKELAHIFFTKWKKKAKTSASKKLAEKELKIEKEKLEKLKREQAASSSPKKTQNSGDKSKSKQSGIPITKSQANIQRLKKRITKSSNDIKKASCDVKSLDAYQNALDDAIKNYNIASAHYIETIGSYKTSFYRYETEAWSMKSLMWKTYYAVSSAILGPLTLFSYTAYQLYSLKERNSAHSKYEKALDECEKTINNIKLDMNASESNLNSIKKILNDFRTQNVQDIREHHDSVAKIFSPENNRKDSAKKKADKVITRLFGNTQKDVKHRKEGLHRRKSRPGKK